MEFKYDAVFGLTYNSNPTYEIDINYIPETMTVNEFINEWQKHSYNSGISFTNAVEEYFQPIYSNY